MTTAGITNDQVADFALCVKTLGWSREQTTRFLVSGWQVERLSYLTAAQAQAAIAALVEELAVWATPADDDPTDSQPSIRNQASAEDADWDNLASVDRPDAPAQLAQRTQIDALMEALHWHPQHRLNHLQKYYGVDSVRQLTVAQAVVALADLEARLSLLPQGVPA